MTDREEEMERIFPTEIDFLKWILSLQKIPKEENNERLRSNCNSKDL
jgi:hypothetical protein